MLDARQSIQIQKYINGSSVITFCSLHELFQTEEKIGVKVLNDKFKEKFFIASDFKFDVRENTIKLLNTLGGNIVVTPDEEILTVEGYIKAGEFTKGKTRRIPLISYRDGVMFEPLVRVVYDYSYTTCVDFKVKHDNPVLIDTFLMRKFNG